MVPRPDGDAFVTGIPSAGRDAEVVRCRGYTRTALTGSVAQPRAARNGESRRSSEHQFQFHIEPAISISDRIPWYKINIPEFYTIARFPSS